MTTYQEALDAIFAHVDYSRTRQTPYNARTYNLERMRVLCERLGNPQHSFPSLHIAGSKGKGSTAAMTAAILQAAGYRTGIYTSPHLHSFRERMRIDGALIPQKRLVTLWEEAQPHVEALPGTTAFEIMTLLAFMYFQQEAVDWGVIEVGLGGRLDATNVVSPRACAITPLSYEHTDLLGDTLGQIASEKAGIIKAGVPVVVGPQAAEAMQVIADVAANAGTALIRVDDTWQYRVRAATAKELTIDIAGPQASFENLRVSLAGHHQAVNATVAVALVTAAHGGNALADEAVRRGLAHTYWPGRLECLSVDPLLVCDGAHNGQSAERLIEALPLFPHRRQILIFGASADKDIDAMLEVLLPRADALIITRSQHPRAAEPATLLEHALRIAPHIPTHSTDDAADAIEVALRLAQPHDLILVTGSIFVVSAAREQWRRLHPEAFAADDWAHWAEPIDASVTPMLPHPQPQR